jgi:hypothetical protein
LLGTVFRHLFDTADESSLACLFAGLTCLALPFSKVYPASKSQVSDHLEGLVKRWMQATTFRELVIHKSKASSAPRQLFCRFTAEYSVAFSREIHPLFSADIRRLPRGIAVNISRLFGG